MRQLIAGNWKMNGLLAEARELSAAVAAGAAAMACDVLICPPFTALAAVGEKLHGTGVLLGAQDCHQEPAGAHTGDISADMLRDIGCSAVILGHSERRAAHHEIDEIVRQKAVAAALAGLTPVVCVGETEEEREAGRDTEVVGWQIEGSLPKGFAGAVAYEPIWAIGTGRTPTEAEVAEMHGFIRAELVRQFGRAGETIRILYGGSVKPANAAAFLAIPEVGGALVGGASLKADEFAAIIRAADALSKSSSGL
jgi:triosephosphate isomerase